MNTVAIFIQGVKPKAQAGMVHDRWLGAPPGGIDQGNYRLKLERYEQRTNHDEICARVAARVSSGMVAI